MLDELAVYLRKVRSSDTSSVRDQFTAFLTCLFKAVESSPRVALVFTLALGKDGKSMDAYAEENQQIAKMMGEAESVAGRKATLLNPTEDDETLEVLRRRLFETIDDHAALETIEAYRTLWKQNDHKIKLDMPLSECVETFKKGFPLHPDVFETFTIKTATLNHFQRVRGMLRILGYTIRELWEKQPSDATALHVHHIDIGYSPIRQEFTTRLEQKAYDSAIRSDIADIKKYALAQQIDEHYKGQPPYASYIARTIFMHSLTFNEALKGITVEHLRYACLSPKLDMSYLDEVRQDFVSESAYLDDRPGAPLRFLVEANLTQIIRQEEKNVDPHQQDAELKDEIKNIFKGKDFSLVFFPTDPRDIDDSAESPFLALLSPDACHVGTTVSAVPALIMRLYQYKSSDQKSFRTFCNNIVFIVAEEGRISDMNAKMSRCLALRALVQSSRLHDLAEHQKSKVSEWEKTSKSELAIAIQKTFRHATNRLHVWWARRQLVMSRAAILAMLLPEESSPQAFLRALGLEESSKESQKEGHQKETAKSRAGLKKPIPTTSMRKIKPLFKKGSPVVAFGIGRRSRC